MEAAVVHCICEPRMLLRAEILRSVPLLTVSLFPKKKDIANSSNMNSLDRVMNTSYNCHMIAGA